MTGFFGVLHLNASDPQTTEQHGRANEAMLRRLGYRGDLQRVEQHGQVTLGAALLPLTDDTDSEIQPLTIDGVSIVTQAYLVNRAELMAQLKAQGAAVNPRAPDPELMLQAYLAWGEDCLTHLQGAFALAIWDAPRAKLLLALDAIGQTVLYYAFTPDALVFSTELNAVRLFPGVDAAVNQTAIAYRLLLRNLESGDATRTPFTGIRQLRAGELWSIDGRESSHLIEQAGTPRSYWTLPLDEPMLVYPRFADYVDHYRALLLEIVESSIRSQRLTLALSGGIDSPTLAATLYLLQQRGNRVEPLAVNEGFHYLHNVREPYFAWLAARRLNLPISFVQGDSYPVAPPLPATMDISCVMQPTLLDEWNRVVTTHSHVLWYGDGPDEIFAVSKLRQVLPRLPAGEALRLYRLVWKISGQRPPLGIRQMLRQRAPSVAKLPRAYHTNYPTWFNPDFEREFDLKAIWEAHWLSEDEDIHRLQPVAYNRLIKPRWHRNFELVSAPPYTQPQPYNPFLDVRMLRFGLSLPPQLSLQPKQLMRAAMRDLLPGELLNRAKEPLGFPLMSLLRQYGTEWIDQWQPVPEVLRYIRRDAVPPIVDSNVDPMGQMRNFLPFTLNNWLRELQETD